MTNKTAAEIWLWGNRGTTKAEKNASMRTNHSSGEAYPWDSYIKPPSCGSSLTDGPAAIHEQRCCSSGSKQGMAYQRHLNTNRQHTASAACSAWYASVHVASPTGPPLDDATRDGVSHARSSNFLTWRREASKNPSATSAIPDNTNKIGAHSGCRYSHHPLLQNVDRARDNPRAALARPPP